MPSVKPTLLYDGDCGFCLKWIRRWQRKSHGAVSFEPFQQALGRFPQVTREQCKESVRLIFPDGRVMSGAHAVLHALALGSRRIALLWMYEHIPGFARVSEAIYQWVAHHRKNFSGGKGETCEK